MAEHDVQVPCCVLPSPQVKQSIEKTTEGLEQNEQRLEKAQDKVDKATNVLEPLRKKTPTHLLQPLPNIGTPLYHNHTFKVSKRLCVVAPKAILMR